MESDTNQCEATYDGDHCELVPGHNGPHTLSIEHWWDQDLTPRPPVEVSPGYMMYLATRFGG